MQPLHIRAAFPDDIPELSRLWYEKMLVQQQFDRRLLMLPDGRARWTQAALEWLADERCMVYMAVDDGQAVGYIVGWVKPSPVGLSPEWMGTISDLAIDPHTKVRGVGSLLLDQMRAWYSEKNIVQILVYAASRSPVEQAFWRASGAAELMDVLWLRT